MTPGPFFFKDFHGSLVLGKEAPSRIYRVDKGYFALFQFLESPLERFDRWFKFRKLGFAPYLMGPFSRLRVCSKASEQGLNEGVPVAPLIYVGFIVTAGAIIIIGPR